MKLRRVLAIGVAMLALLFPATILRRDLHGLSLVYRAADRQGALRQIADLDTVPIGERLLDISGRRESFRVRAYAPVGRSRQAVLLVPGVPPEGIDEPRLVDLARKLAQAGVTGALLPVV